MADSLGLISIPHREADRLHRAVSKGDAEAIQLLYSLWPDDAECFQCGRIIAPGEGTAAILPDPPNARKGFAMLGRTCAECSALPYVWQLRRIIKIMRALYPNWHRRRAGWR
jgi:hypothetical protein